MDKRCASPRCTPCSTAPVPRGAFPAAAACHRASLLEMILSAAMLAVSPPRSHWWATAFAALGCTCGTLLATLVRRPERLYNADAAREAFFTCHEEEGEGPEDEAETACCCGPLSECFATVVAPFTVKRAAFAAFYAHLALTILGLLSCTTSILSAARNEDRAAAIACAVLTAFVVVVAAYGCRKLHVLQALRRTKEPAPGAHHVVEVCDPPHHAPPPPKGPPLAAATEAPAPRDPWVGDSSASPEPEPRDPEAGVWGPAVRFGPEPSGDSNPGSRAPPTRKPSPVSLYFGPPVAH